MSGSRLVLDDIEIAGTFLGRLPIGNFALSRLTATGWTERQGVSLAELMSSDLLARDLSRNATFDKTFGQTTRLGDLGPLSQGLHQHLSIYAGGYFAIRLTVKIPGQWSSADTAGFANQMVDSSTILHVGGASIGSAMDVATAELLALGQTGVPATHALFSQSYTSIVCSQVQPKLQAPLPELPPRLQRDVLTVVVRRPGSFDEFLVRGANEKYKSQSLYVEDFVCATPHNVFVYVPPGRKHLPAAFYLTVYERWRILTAVLARLDTISAQTMEQVPTLPRRLRELRGISEENGKRWIELTHLREAFRQTPSSVAARAKHFDVRVCEMLEVQETYDELERRLGLIESIITTRYSFSLQAVLQKFTLVVSVAAIVVSILSILVSSYLAAGTKVLPGQPEPKATQPGPAPSATVPSTLNR